MKLHAIHGFLGKSSDWNQVPLKGLIAHDLQEERLRAKEDGFLGWTKRFHEKVKDEASCLLGYSLGGRLALHALTENSNKWKAAVIVSAHTGFVDRKAKELRLESDKKWANRFENESWDELLKAWDDQPVFGNIKCTLQRDQTSFIREHLADLLRFFSLGLQENLLPAIENLPMPILWMYGEKDDKAKELAKIVKLKHTSSQIQSLSCGHRIPWEKPEEFASIVNQFINKVFEK